MFRFGFFHVRRGRHEHDDFRSGWAEKSAAAKRREDTAMKKFETARLEMESRKDLKAGTRVTVQLLQPSCHLTEACWKSFRKHVCSLQRWSAKRRVATEQEKKLHGETRKGRVYFVDVIYSVPQQFEKVRSDEKARTLEHYIQCNTENYIQPYQFNSELYKRAFEEDSGADIFGSPSKKLRTY